MEIEEIKKKIIYNNEELTELMLKSKIIDDELVQVTKRIMELEESLEKALERICVYCDEQITEQDIIAISNNKSYHHNCLIKNIEDAKNGRRK